MAFRFLWGIGLFCGVFWACSEEEFIAPDPATTSSVTGTGGSGATSSAPASTSAQTSASSGSGGSGGSGCQDLNEPCSACAFQACNAEYCACFAEQDCAALINCLNGCAGDPVCQQTCMSVPAHQNYISQVLLLGDCASASCTAQCPGVTDQGPCPECLLTNCSTQMNACLAIADCALILDCVQDNCTDPSTFQTCALNCAYGPGSPPTGQNEAVAVGNCLSQQCPNDC